MALGSSVFVFGPLPTRRLGQSLGIYVVPRKACTYSCVYCQLGQTRARRIQPVSFFDPDVVFAEIVKRMSETSPDCITFVGYGEPTLSSDLGWYISQCKAHWSTPVAVITNGSLLYEEEVRRNLIQADIVLLSLDAGSARVFRAINRPHAALEFEKVANGVIGFRRVFSGQIWLKIMLVKDVNDNEGNLRNLRRLVWATRPDRIDVVIPTRPPAETWVEPPNSASVLRAQRLLHTSDIMTCPEYNSFRSSGFGTVRDAVIGLSMRCPLRWDQAKQVATALGKSGELTRLVEIGAIMVTEYGGTRFVTQPFEEVTDGTP